jgi:hypothetical protein
MFNFYLDGLTANRERRMPVPSRNQTERFARRAIQPTWFSLAAAS